MVSAISVKEFEQTLKENIIINIYDFDLVEGSGRVINKHKLHQSLKTCKSIKFYDDALIKTYDVYYDKGHIHKMIRVLLR